MAYYRVEDKEIVPPPEAPLAADADTYAKAAHKKEHDRVMKHVDELNKARAKTIQDEWVSLVVDERTGKPVCLCGGGVQAEYIAGLLNDRPPK